MINAITVVGTFVGIISTVLVIWTGPRSRPRTVALLATAIVAVIVVTASVTVAVVVQMPRPVNRTTLLANPNRVARGRETTTIALFFGADLPCLPYAIRWEANGTLPGEVQGQTTQEAFQWLPPQNVGTAIVTATVLDCKRQQWSKTTINIPIVTASPPALTPGVRGLRGDRDERRSAPQSRTVLRYRGGGPGHLQLWWEQGRL